MLRPTVTQLMANAAAARAMDVIQPSARAGVGCRVALLPLWTRGRLDPDEPDCRSGRRAGVSRNTTSPRKIARSSSQYRTPRLLPRMESETLDRRCAELVLFVRPRRLGRGSESREM